MTYFKELYAGPPPAVETLAHPLGLTQSEVTGALHHLAPNKALPSSSAPAALWKLLAERLAPVITRQFEAIFQPGLIVLPRQWCACELVLLPKPGKSLTAVSQLRPICLLPPMAKLLATALANRLRPYAVTYLAQTPVFAYIPSRGLAQALERVVGHCSQVRALLAAQTNSLFARRAAGPRRPLLGGMMLSLDITQAYDAVAREDLRAALLDAAVPEGLVSAILAIHGQAHLLVNHGGHSGEVRLLKGLRQGCGLSPVLWAVYSGWLLKQLESQNQLTDFVPRSNTTYADDFIFSWLIDSGSALENAYRQARLVLRFLDAKGLTISPNKTVVILEVRGPRAHHALSKYLVTLKDGVHIRFKIQDRNVDLKVVHQHTYLGAQIGFRKFEQQTAQHRMQLATSQYQRLKSVLRCQAVPCSLRMRLWKACIPPCLTHGLDCTGLPPTEAKQVETLLITQARAVARSYSWLTHETNKQFLHRHRIRHPTEWILQAIKNREALDAHLGSKIRPGEAQLQWRQMLRGCLQTAKPEHAVIRQSPTVDDPDRVHNVRLIPVDKIIHEVFECNECGIRFSTAAALKRHTFLQHFAEEQRLARQQEVKQSAQQANMEHARSGMPWCKHCGRRFNTWHNFFYHINARGCAMLRAIYAQPQPGHTLALLSEALVHNPDILEKARQCTWLDLASHSLVKQKLHHCVECHHWSLKPQYVKRHMLAKHPELTDIIQKCASFVKQSNIGLTSPCRFCGETFNRRDAHLRSCVALFSGAFLYTRVARGPPLDSEPRHGPTRSDRGGEPAGDAAPESGRCDYGAAADGSTGPSRHHRTPVGLADCWSGLAKPASDRPDPHGTRPGAGQGRGDDSRQALQVLSSREQGPGSQSRSRQRAATSTSAGPTIRELLRRSGSAGQGQIPAVGRGIHTQGGAAVEGPGHHAHSLDPPARQSNQYYEARHRLHFLPSHRHPGQHGSGPLQDRPDMEGAEGETSGKAGKPDEGHPDAGLAFQCPQPLRADDRRRGEEDAGHKARVAQRVWDSGHGDEMGCHTQATCGGPHGQGAGDHHRQGSPDGAHGVVQGSFGGQQVPCHQTHGGGVRLAGTPDDAGHRFQGGGGGQDMEPLQPAQPFSSVDQRGGLHASRPSTEGTAGTAAGTVYGEAEPMVEQVLKARLGNRSNHCYCNALLKCLWVLAARSPGPEPLLPERLCKFLRGFLSAAGTLYVWGNPFWRAWLGAWQAPDDQHDMAEFLQFLVATCTGLEVQIGAAWEARLEAEGRLMKYDGGCSHPLYLMPGRGDCTIQQLLDMWHLQDQSHALLAPPQGLILQVGRFRYSSDDGRSVKLDFHVVPDQRVFVPVFLHGVETRLSEYKLCAFTVHHGDTPESGHYTAILLCNDRFYKLDDGVPARACDHEEFEQGCSNSYLFFYVRVDV